MDGSQYSLYLFQISTNICPIKINIISIYFEFLNDSNFINIDKIVAITILIEQNNKINDECHI